MFCGAADSTCHFEAGNKIFFRLFITGWQMEDSRKGMKTETRIAGCMRAGLSISITGLCVRVLRGSAGQGTKEGGRPRHMAKEKMQAYRKTGRGKGESRGAVVGKKEGNSPLFARSVLHYVKCPCCPVQGHTGTPFSCRGLSLTQVSG